MLQELTNTFLRWIVQLLEKVFFSHFLEDGMGLWNKNETTCFVMSHGTN